MDWLLRVVLRSSGAIKHQCGEHSRGAIGQPVQALLPQTLVRSLLLLEPKHRPLAEEGQYGRLCERYRAAFLHRREHGFERADYIQHLCRRDWEGCLAFDCLGKALEQHAQ